MCDHKKKLIGQMDYKTGYAPEFCKDCHTFLGDIPASFQAVKEYCEQKKINVHFPAREDYESLPIEINMRMR
jgi:hypothetical protein